MTSTSEEWASLILEISSRNVGVRLVTGKPQPAQPVVAQRILGRDYGFANTISGAILESATEINLEDIQPSLKALDSGDKVRDYAEAHLLPGAVNVVARYRFSGRPFLDRVKVLCEEIDGYKSRIDRQYNSIGKLRKELTARVEPEAGPRLLPEHKKETQGQTVFQCAWTCQRSEKGSAELLQKDRAHQEVLVWLSLERRDSLALKHEQPSCAKT